MPRASRKYERAYITPPVELGPGERLIDGKVYYSADWLNDGNLTPFDRRDLLDAACGASTPHNEREYDPPECNTAPGVPPKEAA